jgi:ArsR family transcriptional regulator, arsenate/arsenite/antimonite-responsive transcriptional repressor
MDRRKRNSGTAEIVIKEPQSYQTIKPMGDKDYSIEELFKALADRTRLRLINLMGDDEVCVCFFVEVLKLNQPKISRHLAYLRRAGVVAARREGKWMHYRIVEPPDPRAANIFREVRASLANDAGMKRDRARLAQICCAPQLPVQLQKAPRPASLVA